MLGRIGDLTRNPRKRTLARAVWLSLFPRDGDDVSLDASLRATYDWLCAAQDAAGDGGVARWYDLLAGRWDLSYPETTGYIIPTFLAYAEARDEPEARARALRMADWEAEIQMEDGAVVSGTAATERGPAVFNTGQCLFGWVAAFEETREEHHAAAARRAADWLVERMEDDGAWRGNVSMLTTANVHTYNNRCAWALAYAASVLDEPRYEAAARRSSDWALTQQTDSGWFAHTGFAEDETPLVHTLSYVIEGLLGVYAFTGDERYLDAAMRATDAVLERYRADGRLGGRLDERWRPTVSWRCLTGDAQVAVVAHRLERLRPGQGYAEAAGALLHDVARAQLGARALDDAGDPARGGVPGSFPVWGDYCTFAAVNWAAKFFLDGLLLELHGVDEKSYPVALRS